MKKVVTISDFDKFEKYMLDKISKIEFMGTEYTNKKDIKYYAKEAFLVREPLIYEVKK